MMNLHHAVCSRCSAAHSSLCNMHIMHAGKTWQTPSARTVTCGHSRACSCVQLSTGRHGSAKGFHGRQCGWACREVCASHLPNLMCARLAHTACALNTHTFPSRTAQTPTQPYPQADMASGDVLTAAAKVGGVGRCAHDALQTSFVNALFLHFRVPVRDADVATPHLAHAPSHP